MWFLAIFLLSSCDIVPGIHGASTGDAPAAAEPLTLVKTPEAPASATPSALAVSPQGKPALGEPVYFAAPPLLQRRPLVRRVVPVAAPARPWRSVVRRAVPAFPVESPSLVPAASFPVAVRVNPQAREFVESEPRYGYGGYGGYGGGGYGGGYGNGYGTGYDTDYGYGNYGYNSYGGQYGGGYGGGYGDYYPSSSQFYF